ncbi:Proteins of 100 residues with WXG [Frankineae bacterium MT45]|nr:Proteins of 100 residues with WXG [Frankineae bacterium MT45]
MPAAVAVAALPGGDEFAQLWQQVDGDAAAVDALAGALSDAASRIGVVQRGVSAATEDVAAGWSGPAASAFTGYMGRLQAASAEVAAGLRRAAAELTTVSRHIDIAKQELTSIAEQVLAEVERLQSLEQSAFTGLVDDLVATEVAAACAQARPVVGRLSAALTSAARGVASAAAGPGYLQLHAPGEGGYLPQRGGRIQWRAIGHGDAVSSAPSSAAGPVRRSSSGSAPTLRPSGDVKAWIEAASAVLEKHGVPASRIDPSAIALIIQHESSGDPHAENLTDSNAAAGHPSKGLMQTIDSTFTEYALPGHGDIWSPVDNIIAGVRYALSRYGSLDNVPGVRAVQHGGSYVGY